jgi:hypothetical protein
LKNVPILDTNSNRCFEVNGFANTLTPKHPQ